MEYQKESRDRMLEKHGKVMEMRRNKKFEEEKFFQKELTDG